MYLLQQQIGEGRVNTALRNFLNDWKSFDNPNKPKRYATSQDLIQYFKEVTPKDLQIVIKELFEEVNEVDLAL